MKLRIILALVCVAAAQKSERKKNRKERNKDKNAGEEFRAEVARNAQMSVWAQFTKSIGDELETHMTLPGLNIRDYLGSILSAYQDDHPETGEKIEAMKNADSGEFDESSKTTGGPKRKGLRSGSMNSLTQEDKMHMMKYLQLKYTILFLQSNKFIGKYCFYGCWCLPAGAGFHKQGFGVPVDNIDRSCREFTTCYNCLYNPEPFKGENCDEAAAMQQKYNIQGSADQKTGAISLYCTDPSGSCLRSRCECDKALSEKLSKYEAEWNMQNHHKWGNPPFIASQLCGSKLATPQQAAQSDKDVASNPSMPSIARGSYDQQQDSFQKLTELLNSVQQSVQEDGQSQKGDLIINVTKTGGGGGGGRRPFMTVKSSPIYGAIVGCCGRAPDVHYYRDGQRCCIDGEVVDANAPCSMEFL